jgi:uncharacterized membrane protein YkvA (DUF1232 family)
MGGRIIPVRNLKARLEALNAQVATVFFAMKHPQTPWLAKVLGTVVVVYALSPIDLIPDFIPVIGYLDDLILLPILIALTIKLIPKAILDDARQQAIDFHRESQSKPIYALAVVGVYLVLIAVVLWAIL